MHNDPNGAEENAIEGEMTFSPECDSNDVEFEFHYELEGEWVNLTGISLGGKSLMGIVDEEIFPRIEAEIKERIEEAGI